ncbi:MAG: glycosyltransferase family 2 protein [Candidatus Terrybacteria bacterium]|nr:glycosyltransferase family 2 protein [Candidatus Terrybacteria bacterium]
MGIETPPNEALWILILNWNGWRDTIECLKSLKTVRVSPEYQLRILVIDNGSTDASLRELRSFRTNTEGPSFEILETGANLGFAGGNNAGMRKAVVEGADWVLLLNNDTVVDRSFAAKLLSAGKEDSRIGLLNPKILLFEAEAPSRRIWFIGGKIDWLRTRGGHMGYRKEDRGQYDTPSVQDSDYATGCCLLARAATIRDIGLLPEEYFVYHEDVAWSLTARKRGWRCAVVPAAVVWHKGAASSREHSASYIRYHVRNGLILVRHAGNPMQIMAAYFLTLPRALWQCVKWVVFPRKRLWASATLEGIRDAWLGRTGPIVESPNPKSVPQSGIPPSSKREIGGGKILNKSEDPKGSSPLRV